MATASSVQPEKAALTVLENLENQHDWTSLELVDIPELSKTFVKGLPPRLLYMHPDDQIAALEIERSGGPKVNKEPVVEWVLPLLLIDKWSLSKLASAFDALETIPGGHSKRLVLATVHNDSTVVYYLVHEGMVKPRQN